MTKWKHMPSRHVFNYNGSGNYNMKGSFELGNGLYPGMRN